MKQSFTNPQTFQMYNHEFESRGEREVSGYSFNLEFENGKVINNIAHTAVARDLRDVMVSNMKVKEILSNHKFKINLDTNFTLHIKHLK